MTNINCTENCQFQQDGKCNFDTVINSGKMGPETENSGCPYQRVPEH